ncbi:lysozyme [Thauera butanivorans]|uniref:lysozyme n=1 Tax=Thauera butanivorans TaxID=86174 RepID=UPI003AB1491C
MKILPNKNLPWPIVWSGVVEIANSEGCRLRAYRDIAGVWTIGWGETENITPGEVWTQQWADDMLCARLTELAAGVSGLLTRPATAHQLAAMVSLAYNIGLAGFARSSVLRAHNAGNTLAAARAFALWNKARVDGVLREVKGLTRRRARESALYLTAAPEARPPLDAVPAEHAAGIVEMPDAAPESRLHSSPIAQSGAVSIATGGLAAASAVSDDIQSVAWGMGIDPLLVLAAVAVTVGAVILWQRHKQRKEGWA